MWDDDWVVENKMIERTFIRRKDIIKRKSAPQEELSYLEDHWFWDIQELQLFVWSFNKKELNNIFLREAALVKIILCYSLIVK